MASPFVVTLAAADRQILEATARSGRAEHRQVVRARIVLATADGQSNAGIARELRIVVDTVRKWRTRFCRDRPRSGRPRVFGAAVVTEVKALACELPTQTEVPLARWSCPELAREPSAAGICKRVSPSTVRRWLAQDAIKPWQHRSWTFPRDRTSRLRLPGSWICMPVPGTVNRWVRTTSFLSSDEKPSVQARYRKYDAAPTHLSPFRRRVFGVQAR